MKYLRLLFVFQLLCVVKMVNALEFNSAVVVSQFDKSTIIQQKLKKAQECINGGNYTAAKGYIDGVLKLDKNNAKAKKLLEICNNGGQSKSSPKNIGTQSNTTRSNRRFSVSKTDLSFGANGGSEIITITSDAVWSVSVNPDAWGHLSRNGNTLTLMVDQNSTSSTRSDYFKIKSGDNEIRVNINQSGRKYITSYLNLSKSSLTFPSSGGTETLEVSSNSTWEIKTSTYSWGHLYKNGNSLTVSIDANNSATQRTDYFVIKSGDIEKRVDISQNGRTVPMYSSGSNVYNSYYGVKKTNNWWKGRVTFGWNVSSFDINSKNMSWRTGFRLRFGKYSDFFNFIIGIDYSIQLLHVEGGQMSHSYSDYYGYYEYLPDEWKILHHEIFIPVEFRLNIAKCGNFARWYIGAGVDAGLKFADGEVSSESTSVAIDPMTGFMFKNFDFGIDCKIYLNHASKQYNNNKLPRFGFYGIWYF